MRFKRKKKIKQDLFLDEVFMDSHNSPEFDTQQFEGRIEKPIKKNVPFVIAGLFFAVLMVFTTRLYALQVEGGERYFDLSVRNSLGRKIIFSERGVVQDRTGKELVWNVASEGDFVGRQYINNTGFGTLLGYVAYPQKDSAGFYWRTEYEGIVGIEKDFNDFLNGENGEKIIERNALGEVVSENIINPPMRGNTLRLSIDAELQHVAYEAMKNLSQRIGYEGGAVAIMDIETGELYALTTYPEYDPNILVDGKDVEAIRSLFNDPRKPFLNRALSGLYSPGSIVKPFIALAALHENIITERSRFFSNGRLEIVSPYDPNVVAVFRDWQDEPVGWTDVRKAIAESVNNFFYIIGGGHAGQEGLGIARIERYMNLFEIGTKTSIPLSGEISGVVPNPEWKSRIFRGDIWRLGDTYNTSIGQYGFQVTPIQMVRSVASLVNGGFLVQPQVVINQPTQKIPLSMAFDKGDLEVVKEGMRNVVTEGTGRLMNVSYVEVAAKTGTAQTGPRNSLINSWVIGFFPYENPKFAFTVLMERGPSKAELSSAFVVRSILDWMRVERPEYLVN